MKVVEEQIPNLIREQKDRQVIAHLYKELFPTVRGYIRKNNGIEDDAHDVLQDAIMYFYKQVIENVFDEKYKVYGYVYRLAINRWINKLNKDKKMVFQTEMSEDMAKDSSYKTIGETEETEKNENSLLNKFVAIIGEKCVELLAYRIYSNLMFEDICLRMDFNSEAAAKMSFNRCRKKMVDAVKSNPALADQLRKYA